MKANLDCIAPHKPRLANLRKPESNKVSFHVGAQIVVSISRLHIRLFRLGIFLLKSHSMCLLNLIKYSPDIKGTVGYSAMAITFNSEAILRLFLHTYT